jgi:titin
VAATGKYGERASYSNYGSAVTLAAPGGGDFDWGIRSTVNASKTSPTVGTYRNFQGTIMAAPHVAGAVSLLLSLSPTLTPTQTRTVLTSSATAFPATGTYSTCSARCGAGVLNVQAALILAGNLRPPGVPTALQAIAAPGSVTLSWEAPVDTGGTDIVDYRIQRSTNGGLSWATVRDSTSPLAGATITGLTNGITYTFRVAAINRVTVGDWSLLAAATPATVPGRARSFVARRGDQRVSLSWRKPISTGGAAIQHYSIEESTDGVQWNEIVQVPGTSTATTVLGLTNGVRYRFRVTAVNQAGAGTRSTLASATPLSVPGVPGNLDGTPTNRSVALTWTAPLTDGGTRITRYIVQRSRDGGSTWTTLLRGTSVNPEQLVKYLENGRDYVFRVSARNSLGRGPWSIPFTTRPRTTASAPLAVTVNAGNGEVAVSWSAPKSTGGSEITAYQIEVSTDGLTWSPAGTTADGAARSFTASALVNDTSYRFRVAAVNAAGTGSFSDPRTATPHA